MQFPRLLRESQGSVHAVLHKGRSSGILVGGSTFLPHLDSDPSHQEWSPSSLPNLHVRGQQEESFAALYERDCFWLSSKALKAPFPLWLYAVTFFVTVPRLLGNATLNKTFSFFSLTQNSNNKGSHC